MRTKDILKQAIKEFNGTVIVVSHDREFLDGLVEKVYEFGDGKVKECLGGIYEFLEKKKIASLAELEVSKSVNKPEANAKIITPTIEQSSTKLSYAEQREREKTIKRAEKKVSEAENEISKIEAEIAVIEDKITSGDVDSDIFNQHAAKNKQLENAMSLWELASMELDELKTKLNNN
jgi:ATP-binding cassette subfamily F protein 3